VQFARTLAERYEHGKLEKLIEKFGIDGKTPDFSDIQEHYPNIKMFMSDRVRWENWQPKKERPAKVECWVGYATLALARADGDTNYVIKEMDTMAKIGLGPAYDLTLIGELGQAKTGPANGIWLQDQAVQIHEGIKRGERPGLYAHRLSSVFLPELVDIGLL
jgi:hypothetical protein